MTWHGLSESRKPATDDDFDPALETTTFCPAFFNCDGMPRETSPPAELLEPRRTDRVLEVGTGSGYAAAVLSHIVKMVYTVERHVSLASGAQKVFDRLGYGTIRIRRGDGRLGWPEKSPFEAVVLTAGTRQIPQALMTQLAIGVRLVIPVGPQDVQERRFVRRTGKDAYDAENHLPVRFVPLVGGRG
jgi:protein-L-isoaspartate(D-aspartate) O-methyltransferase